MSHVRAGRFAILTFLLGAAACAPDSNPSGMARAVAPRRAASLVEAPPQTCGLGGYVTNLIVDPATTQANDGRHFTRITDAVAAVRTGRIFRGEKTIGDAACRITIDVAAGTYSGAFVPSTTQEVFPLVLDAPRVTLEGAQRMALDAKGRATGALVDPSQVTVLAPSAPLTGTQSLVIVTDSANGLWGGGANDIRGDSVTVRGFEFRSGYAAPDPTAAGGGLGVFAMRVQGLLIDQNTFAFMLASAVDGRASSGLITHNAIADLGNGGCAICVAGPASDTISGNTVARSGIVGVFALAATQSQIPTGVRALTFTGAPALGALIDNNYIAGEQQHPVGTAIRVSAIGQGVSGTIGQQTTVKATSNDLSGNRFGMIADAGFPPLNTSTTIPSGNVTLTLGGNTFSGSCQANLLVAFARHTRALGTPTPAGNAGYLKNSTFNISLGNDLAWSDVWYSHPPTDTGVTLNNTLVVNGAPVGNGALSAYDGVDCQFRPSASAWIGLKNSDDVGTNFDLLTEVRRNGSVVATGQINGVSGGSSGFNNAVQRTIPTALSGVVNVKKGDVLSVTIYARIATGIAGHTSGTARLWYGSSVATSRIMTLASTAAIDTVSTQLYLAPQGTLTDTPGAGPSQTADVLVKKSDGNPFRPLGTWTRVF